MKTGEKGSVRQEHIPLGILHMLVATVLFAVLTVRNPDAARVFSAMVEHGGPLATPLMPEQRVAIQADIASAFRAAFLTMAAFTAAGFFLAVTNPLKRI